MQSVKKLQEEGLRSIPIEVEVWSTERQGELFKQLMIDDNIDPNKRFATIEAEIVDTALHSIQEWNVYNKHKNDLPHIDSTTSHWYAIEKARIVREETTTENSLHHQKNAEREDHSWVSEVRYSSWYPPNSTRSTQGKGNTEESVFAVSI